MGVIGRQYLNHNGASVACELDNSSDHRFAGNGRLGSGKVVASTMLLALAISGCSPGGSTSVSPGARETVHNSPVPATSVTASEESPSATVSAVPANPGSADPSLTTVKVSRTIAEVVKNVSGRMHGLKCNVTKGAQPNDGKYPSSRFWNVYCESPEAVREGYLMYNNFTIKQYLAGVVENQQNNSDVYRGHWNGVFCLVDPNKYIKTETCVVELADGVIGGGPSYQSPEVASRRLLDFVDGGDLRPVPSVEP